MGTRRTAFLLANTRTRSNAFYIYPEDKEVSLELATAPAEDYKLERYLAGNLPSLSGDAALGPTQTTNWDEMTGLDSATPQVIKSGSERLALLGELPAGWYRFTRTAAAIADETHYVVANTDSYGWPTQA